MTQIQISHYPLPVELYRYNLYFSVRWGGGDYQTVLVQFTINGVMNYECCVYQLKKYTVFNTKVLRGHYWRRDRHFTWSSEPREGLSV